MNATVRDLDGDDAGEVDLPDVFETQFRPDLISRAVNAARANRRQDYGTDDYAGLRTPAESFGSGRGMAHVPRQDGQGRRVPQAVKGRAAHPPKAETDRGLDMNTKERKLAVRAAIAATTDVEHVAERGHRFDDDLDLPLVVSDEFEDLEKTQEPKSLLFVTSSAAGPSKAARNLAGADVATATNVGAEDLAPGGHPGRLTVWTESALEEVADR